jgi:hypothetical protein
MLKRTSHGNLLPRLTPDTDFTPEQSPYMHWITPGLSGGSTPGLGS